LHNPYVGRGGTLLECGERNRLVPLQWEQRHATADRKGVGRRDPYTKAGEGARTNARDYTSYRVRRHTGKLEDSGKQAADYLGVTARVVARNLVHATGVPKRDACAERGVNGKKRVIAKLCGIEGALVRRSGKQFCGRSEH
jgi:hypothetical protein